MPPKTPAMHNGFEAASQIMISSECNSLSTPSKVVNFVPDFNVFTTTLLPSIFSASNACRGCPNSCKT